MSQSATPESPVCPSCGAAMVAGVNFCEACGFKMTPGEVDTSASAAELDELSPISAATVRPGEHGSAAPAARPPCKDCGGEVAADLYCTQCGTKAPSERDHFEEAPTALVAGVCDRGQRHPINEDAMALWADDRRAVLVVCDGVSNSDGAEVASLAAARAALQVLQPELPAGMGVPESRTAAITQVFTNAVARANDAVLTVTPEGSTNPPSCTFVAAVAERDTIWYAGVGDSRIYHLPDAGEPVQLTVDDSMAQVLMAGGTPREEAESSPQAHSITKWLGKDSPDIVPRVGSVPIAGPGWLLACSDGLWNYASEPAQIVTQMTEANTLDPAALATALTAFANAAGGHDNITVAFARVGEAAIEHNPTTDEGESDG